MDQVSASVDTVAFKPPFINATSPVDLSTEGGLLTIFGTDFGPDSETITVYLNTQQLGVKTLTVRNLQHS